MKTYISFLRHLQTTLISSIGILIPIMTISLVSWFQFQNEPHSKTLLISTVVVCLAFLLGVILFYLWCFLFGDKKNGNIAKLEINEDGISYSSIFYKNRIEQKSYEGYKLQGIFKNKLLISSSLGNSITLYLGMFTDSQKNEIFSNLEKIS